MARQLRGGWLPIRRRRCHRYRHPRRRRHPVHLDRRQHRGRQHCLVHQAQLPRDQKPDPHRRRQRSGPERRLLHHHPCHRWLQRQRSPGTSTPSTATVNGKAVHLTALVWASKKWATLLRQYAPKSMITSAPSPLPWPATLAATLLTSGSAPSSTPEEPKTSVARTILRTAATSIKSANLIAVAKALPT